MMCLKETGLHAEKLWTTLGSIVIMIGGMGKGSYVIIQQERDFSNEVDSSYHIRTNMSVRRGISVHSIHNGVVLFFLQRVHLERLLEFEVKVDVHKGAQRFKREVDNKCVSFIQFVFSSIVVIW